MAAGVGAEVDIGEGAIHALLFGEDQARYVVAVPAAQANWLTVNAEGAGIPFRKLGAAGGAALTVKAVMSISVENMVEAHESWFPDFMSGRLEEKAAA
jgi:phosphoribosylformylglycinamidine (FGAM) synthase-like enzyme